MGESHAAAGILEGLQALGRVPLPRVYVWQAGCVSVRVFLVWLAATEKLRRRVCLGALLFVFVSALTWA